MFAFPRMPAGSSSDPRARNHGKDLSSIPRAGTRQATALVATLLLGLGIRVPNAAAQMLPVDARATATVPSGLFASWFEGGKPVLNGRVRPADSLRFADPHNDNVGFYQWAEQMFLWLTSPVCDEGGIVLNSPEFYAVSREQNCRRTLSRNQPGQPPNFALRAQKPGPNDLPVIFDTAGRMYEVIDKTGQHKVSVVNDKRGEEVQVGSISLGKPDGKPTLFDTKGKPIIGPKPIGIPPKLRDSAVVERIRAGDVSAFLTASGDPINVGVGQVALNQVLLTQGALPVYYMISVNDVYVYFLSGAKGGAINPTPTNFPTKNVELGPIVDFARARGVTLAHPDALCLAVKTSWVEADQLPSSDSYIRMTASIPNYDKTTHPHNWTPNGTKTADLALVGLHVAGSVKGHPEMIWATFEHFGNTPNADYQYYSTASSNAQTVRQDTAGTWLFCQSGASGTFNDYTATALSDGTISLSNGSQIKPTNIIRFKPFGASSTQRPNPRVRDSAASNTQVISMNNSVLGQLIKGDIRANYFMLGATWTDGAAPSYPFDETCNNVVGTSQLTNSTMETFSAKDTLYNRDTNCFSCHKNTAGTPGKAVTTDVSHVFSELQGL